ncbi:hypothetical protein GQ55_9G589200 [Panicum hallii var. hallii]|uniref:Uncharacterized protein n=1 Tax=Panicum hallii var. hallii TaxID=1504633 RepID=A0A2T7CGS5_9POAL|nr:hypothetical protein GQ55_9G589200 [Panicum hallii var. hallii]
MRSSRGRAIKPTKAAIADAAARRGKGNGARGSRRGRGAATSPRGGRGTTTAPRGGRGAATAPRGGRGATIASRGGRGPRRLEFVSEEAHENDGVENDDEYDGEEEHEDDREEEHDGERIEEEAEVQLEADGEEEDGDQAIVYLRGPAGLPPLPATDHEKLVIKPTGDFHWIELGGGKRRNPNGVVTVILKECFPGLVNFNGRTEPPWTWEHYAAAPDAPDEDGVEYSNCLERVEERFWQYFRWATDPEDTEAEKTKKEHDARRVLRNVIKKRVSQMYYEERKTAVVFYYARVKKEKITRTQACGIRLTETQYMQAIPSWAAPYADCWLQIVRQKWCNDEWTETSNSCKERRSLMSGAAHRQGSSSFPRYKKIMEEKGKRPMSDMAAYVASRHGSENGVLCNGRAQQILVIIHSHLLFSLCCYISLLLWYGDNFSNRKGILKLQRKSMVQILM